MNENKKREIIGVVVSDKADKTITVKVRLVMTRPLSKTKRYELVEIIEKAVIL